MSPKNLSLLLILSSLISYSPLNAMQRYKQHAHVASDVQRRQVMVKAHITQVMRDAQERQMQGGGVIIAKTGKAVWELIKKGIQTTIIIVMGTLTDEQKKQVKSGKDFLEQHRFLNDGIFGDIAKIPNLPGFMLDANGKLNIDSPVVQNLMEYVAKEDRETRKRRDKEYRRQLRKNSPYGLHYCGEGQPIHTFWQKALDEAIWDPTTRRWFGIVDDNIVAFALVPGKSRYFSNEFVDARLDGYELKKKIVKEKQQQVRDYNNLVELASTEIKRGEDAKISAEALWDALENYHPHGLYVAGSNQQECLQNGQAALDAAILEPKTGYFLGMENNKIIRFMYVGVSGQTEPFPYVGASFDGNVSWGTRDRILREQKRVAAARADLQAMLDILMKEKDHPYGKAVSSAGNFQAVLDEAVWEPSTRELWGVTDGERAMGGGCFVLFTSNTPNSFAASRASPPPVRGHPAGYPQEPSQPIQERVRHRKKEIRAYRDLISSILSDGKRESEKKIDFDAAAVLEHYHPNGVYVGGLAINDDLPKDGQAALDYALLDPKSKALYGVEDDRLIRFTDIGLIPATHTDTGIVRHHHFQFKASFWKHEAQAGLLALAKDKRKKAEIRKEYLLDKLDRLEAGPPGGEDEKCERLIYKESPKHHPNASGSISRAPKEGQKILDASIRLTWKLRAGIEDGKLVLFRREERCTYHGYVVEDPSKLGKTIKKLLKDFGLMRPKK